MPSLYTSSQVSCCGKKVLTYAVLCVKFYFAEIFCTLQPHCSGLQNYKFGGSARTGRVALRSAVKRRKSALLEQSHISPCLHRSNICRQELCQLGN